MGRMSEIALLYEQHDVNMFDTWYVAVSEFVKWSNEHKFSDIDPAIIKYFMEDSRS